MSWRDRGLPHPGKVALLVLAGVVVLVGVILGTVYLVGTLKKETAGFRGNVDAIEQVKAQGRFRIAAYDHFFDLCSSIQGDEARLAALDVEQQAGATPERYAQINAFRTAIVGNRAAKVARYNADAGKDYTIGQFRSAKLPFTIDPNERTTQCVTP